jgi:hypothetical protein
MSRISIFFGSLYHKPPYHSKKQKPLQVLNLQGFFVGGSRKGAQCIDPMFIGLFFKIQFRTVIR